MNDTSAPEVAELQRVQVRRFAQHLVFDGVKPIAEGLEAGFQQVGIVVDKGHDPQARAVQDLSAPGRR